MKTEVKNTKKIWRHGNVLDIAIVLLLVAALLAIGYRYYETNIAQSEENMGTYRITFSVENVPTDVVEALRVDQAVYFDDGTQLGELLRHEKAPVNKTVYATPALVTVQDGDGNYVNVEIPDGSRKDVQGAILCRATRDEQGTLLVGGVTPVTPGQRMTVHTERVTLTLTVTAVTAK